MNPDGLELKDQPVKTKDVRVNSKLEPKSTIFSEEQDTIELIDIRCEPQLMPQ